MRTKSLDENPLAVRCGIHTSTDITAAVVGTVKRTYDLFGKGVQVTQLMEATGKVNQVHISGTCYNSITTDATKELFYRCFEPKQLINHGKLGDIEMPEATYITRTP